MSHGRRYRFDLVVHELQAADTATYQTTLLAFINCAILGAPDIHQRNRIRTEFFSEYLGSDSTTVALHLFYFIRPYF